MVLTEKQKGELNKGILEYLNNNSYKKTAQLFEDECKLTFDQNEFKGTMQNILEKKWLSIVRLQKKVMELEQRVEELQNEVQKSSKFPKGLNQENLADQYTIKTPAKYSLQGHRANITSVSFHPNYSIIATSSEDGTIKLWDFESGQYERTLKGHTGTVNQVAFDKQGKLLASCSTDLTIKLWELTQFTCIKTLNGHEHNVSSIEFLNSGDHLISASRDKTIKIWEISTGYCIKTLEGHQDWVRKIALNEVGNQCASCSNDETIMLWNIDINVNNKQSGPLKILKGHQNVIETVIFINQELSKKNYLRSRIYSQQE
eukprot:TRINITY_DN6321_c0_g1_i1.p1 TRINITY_DN6321_c0_g1~~TRINITY_DN6321_c0_g1_i1.p1  ORF type:complete len:316 (+),score=44.53 TRINITY_DN6321_c0_g1_i1:185-1132(+)